MTNDVFSFETPQGCRLYSKENDSFFYKDALGIGAASFASVSGTSFGDGTRSLSLSKCRSHILTL